MYKIIDSRYCDDKFVSLEKDEHVAHFIISIDEIIYLNRKNQPLLTNSINSQNYSMFQREKDFNDSKINIIFEYNKPYIDFIASIHGYGVQQDYFFKGTNRALHISEPLTIDERYMFGKEKVDILSREKIEDIFNKNNYDAMYVIDVHGKVLFANNKINGLVTNRKIIPSDEEIVKWDLDNRIADFNLAKLFNSSFATRKNYDVSHTPKTIDEIKDFKIYGGLVLHTYSNMLLTVKNGKFDLKWFRVDLLEKDKFKLTTTNISVIEPTVDDIINYTREEDMRLKKLEEEKEKKLCEPQKKKKRKWFKNI